MYHIISPYIKVIGGENKQGVLFIMNHDSIGIISGKSKEAGMQMDFLFFFLLGWLMGGKNLIGNQQDLIRSLGSLTTHIMQMEIHGENGARKDYVD